MSRTMQHHNRNGSGEYPPAVATAETETGVQPVSSDPYTILRPVITWLLIALAGIAGSAGLTLGWASLQFAWQMSERQAIAEVKMSLELRSQRELFEMRCNNIESTTKRLEEQNRQILEKVEKLKP